MVQSLVEEEEEEEEDVLGFNYALLWLFVITVIIGYVSNIISSTIESAARSANIPPVFLAAILLPIVGNASEHAGSIMFAVKNKLELTLGVAVGSSTQIALLVLPVIVVIGWIFEKPMQLNFSAFEAGALLTTVVSVTFAIKDGSSNWLIGLILIGEYVIISVAFYTFGNTELR